MSVEIKSNIAKLDAAIKSPATPANMLDKLKAKKSELESELKKLESATKEVKKIEPKTPNKSGYKLGDMYSEDFDDNGMLRMGLKANSTWSKKDLQKLFDSFEDVNFHIVAAPLHAALHKSTTKKEEEENIAKFHKLIREELGEEVVEKKEQPKKIAAKATKQKVEKKISKAVASAKALLEKLRATKAQTEFNKGRSKDSIEEDAGRKALPMGKRVSASGNTYYETRANRSDISTKRKPYLELGGGVGGEVDTLILVFKDEENYELAKQWFTNKSLYFYDNFNDEFRTLSFIVSGQKDADKLEHFLSYELNKEAADEGINITGFHFESTGLEYAKGGSIPNNYEGKTAEQVWDEWSVEQREHFLSDHDLYKTKADPTMTSKELKEYDGNAVGWGDDLKRKIELHIERGQYKEGGEIEDEQSFHTGDKIKNKTTGQKAEVVKLNTGGNQLMESYLVRTEDGKTFYWWASDMEVCYECGGRMKRGGNVEHYNTGISWHQDRAKHNKSEDWEMPLNERKEKGGSLEHYNTGRSWHQDRERYNKSEDWEKPLSERKMEGGGEMKTRKEYANLVREKYALVDKMTDQQVVDKWNEWYKERNIEYGQIGLAKAKEFREPLANKLIESDLTEEEYNTYYEQGGEMYAKGGEIPNFRFKKGDIVYIFQHTSISDKGDKKYIVGNLKSKNLQRWAKIEIVENWSEEKGWESFKAKFIEGDFAKEGDDKMKKGDIFVVRQSQLSKSNKRPISMGYESEIIKAEKEDGYLEKGGKVTFADKVKAIENKKKTKMAKGGVIYHKSGNLKSLRDANGKIVKEITVKAIKYVYKPTYKTYNSVDENKPLHKTDY